MFIIWYQSFNYFNTPLHWTNSRRSLYSHSTVNGPLMGLLIESDGKVRAPNCSVLELAPCSVGILVDRGSLSHSTVSSEASYSIAVIFIGGNDDREALMFAKRMANDPNISLTVIRFVDSGGIEVVSSWDKMIDSEILKDVKLNNVGDANVIYIEQLVKDGPRTALIVRYMVEE